MSAGHNPPIDASTSNAPALPHKRHPGPSAGQASARLRKMAILVANCRPIDEAATEAGYSCSRESAYRLAKRPQFLAAVEDERQRIREHAMGITREWVQQEARKLAGDSDGHVKVAALGLISKLCGYANDGVTINSSGPLVVLNSGEAWDPSKGG